MTEREPTGLRLLLVGFGRVGRALAEILVGRAAYPALAGRPELDGLRVVGITTGSRGALADPAGVDLASALAAVEGGGRFTPEHPAWSELGTAEAVATLDYDVLVELSPLSVAGRGEPALGWVRTALGRGRHVVSANKGPVAWGYRELAALAAEQGVSFLFESTVMDGAPVYNLARHCLPGVTVERVEGVLSSTTNVILEALAEGLPLEAALERARDAGVVEADPEDDLAGWDAAVKLACLANVLMGVELEPEEVERTDVREIERERLAAARARGRRLKLVARAERRGSRAEGGAGSAGSAGAVGSAESGVRATVEAVELPLEDPLAQVAGTGSALRLVTDLPGRLVIVEEAPDLRTTAYGVLADLLHLLDRPGAVIGRPHLPIPGRDAKR